MAGRVQQLLATLDSLAAFRGVFFRGCTPAAEFGRTGQSVVTRGVMPATRSIEDHFEVPRHTGMGGSARYDKWEQPLTGFTSSGDHVVPDWQPAHGVPVRMRLGAEMWEVLDDGTQRLVGVLKGGDWVSVDEPGDRAHGGRRGLPRSGTGGAVRR